MNDAQLQIAIDILKAGRFSVDSSSSDDEIAASAFVFDNGLLFFRDQALKALRQEWMKRKRGEVVQ